MSEIAISVERLLEQEVLEIDRFGEEKYIKPLTLSEELAHFAEKIDFYEGEEQIDQPEEEKADAKKEKWPWETMHSKIRLALSEMCLLLDVLQCLNRKKYMVLDRVSQNAEVPKQSVQMLEKRKFLARVGSFISRGAGALRKEVKPAVIDLAATKSNGVMVEQDVEYYIQLMKLRQHWRVKKTGAQIIVDISFKTAGSRFWHSGLIEVTPMHSTEKDGENDKRFSVKVGTDIVQNSSISICVVDEKDNTKMETSLSYVAQIIENTKPLWKQLLMKGQEHLFNKDIFANLAQLSFQGSFIGIDVIDNELKCKVFDDVTVTLTHCIGENEAAKTTTTFPNSNVENLRIDLYQDMLKEFEQNLKHYLNETYSKHKRSSTFNNLLNQKQPAPTKSILHTLISNVKRIVWVNRLNKFLWDKCLEFSNLKLSFHWNNTNRSLRVSSMNVTVAFASNFKSTMCLKLQDEAIKLMFSDFTSMPLPLGIDALNEAMDRWLSRELIKYINELAGRFNWVTLYKGINTEVDSQRLKNVLTIYSLATKHYLRFSVSEAFQIAVESSALSDDMDGLLDNSFAQMNIVFEAFEWKNMPGDTLLEKLEALLLST